MSHLLNQLQHVLQVLFQHSSFKILLLHAKEAIPLVLSLQRWLRQPMEKEPDSIPQQLQTLETRCYEWLNEIAACRQPEKERQAPNALDTLTEAIIALYIQLYQQYPGLHYHPVPKLMQQYYYGKLITALRGWSPNREEAKPHPLYGCCENMIARALLQEEACTFAQLQHLQVLVKSITQLDYPSDDESTRKLLLHLLFHNCNDPQFMEQAHAYWTSVAEAAHSIPEMMEQWLLIEQQILIWQQENKPRLYPGKQSCGEVLQALVQKSKEKLQLWAQCQMHIPTPDSSSKLKTALNLSEFAIVLRLLNETGVLQHRVMMEFLRCWAQWVQIGAEKPISVESLKSRYYSPEPASLRKVKDLLLEMRHKLAQW